MERDAQRRFSSDVRVTRPYLMLVQVEHEEEPAGLTDLPVRVVRVRHPVPAFVRMRVLKPCVVIVGRAVTVGYLPELFRAAREIDAKLMDAKMASGDGLRSALASMLRVRIAPPHDRPGTGR